MTIPAINRHLDVEGHALAAYQSGKQENGEPFLLNKMPLGNPEGDPLCGALANLFGAVQIADGQLAAQGQETREKAQEVFFKMQQHFASLAEHNRILAEENRQLREMLHDEKSLHQAEVNVLKAKTEASDSAVKTLRQELTKAEQQFNQKLTAAIKDKENAVKAAIQAGDAKWAAVREADRQQAEAIIKARETSIQYHKNKLLDIQKIAKAEMNKWNEYFEKFKPASLGQPTQFNFYPSKELNTYYMKGYVEGGRLSIHGIVEVVAQFNDWYDKK